eukprot:COSAG06_NODE_9932_length_1788_cov_1.805802_1_plen_117_part_00
MCVCAGHYADWLNTHRRAAAAAAVKSVAVTVKSVAAAAAAAAAAGEPRTSTVRSSIIGNIRSKMPLNSLSNGSNVTDNIRTHRTSTAVGSSTTIHIDGRAPNGGGDLKNPMCMQFP